MAALVARRLEESLTRVEASLGEWRLGERELFSVHDEVLRHTARTNALSSRLRTGLDEPGPLLREAFQLGLIGREEFVHLTGCEPEELSLPVSLDDEVTRLAARSMPEKRSVMEKLIQDGPVLIHLDARQEGVNVPPAHKDDAKLVLRLGHSLRPPIPDLVIDADGIRATLSFRGVSHGCVIPWVAVYAIVGVDDRGLIWREDVPPEAALDFSRGPWLIDPGEDRTPPTSSKRGHLKLVT